MYEPGMDLGGGAGGPMPPTGNIFSDFFKIFFQIFQNMPKNIQKSSISGVAYRRGLPPHTSFSPIFSSTPPPHAGRKKKSLLVFKQGQWPEQGNFT